MVGYPVVESLIESLNGIIVGVGSDDAGRTMAVRSDMRKERHENAERSATRTCNKRGEVRCKAVQWMGSLT